MEQKTIILPENLRERRRLLEAELSAVVEELTTTGVREDIKELLNKAGFKEGTATVEWEFYGEFDDEGGTDYRPRGYSLSVNGESVDMEDEFFDENGEELYLYDWMADTLCDYGDDLYEVYITEVTVKLD